MFEVSVKRWGKHLAVEIQVCFGQMQVRAAPLLFEPFSCLLEAHLHLNSHQELQMYITSVRNSPVQLTCMCLWLLKVQFRCDKFTQGPSGSTAGRGNTAHAIKMTTGIPAIPHVVFVRESFLCCWSYELARVC